MSEIVKNRKWLMEQMYKIPAPENIRPIIDNIYDNVKEDYLSLSIDNTALVSYARNTDEWDNPSRRVKLSLGRYLTRHYGITMTAEITEWCMQVMAQFNFNLENFKLREDVYNVYNTVSHSCMSGMDCTRFYENNGVQILTYPKNTPTCRALFWPIVKKENKDVVSFLDRIYPNDGSHVELFHLWAKNKNAITRPHNSMPDQDVFKNMEELTVSPIEIGKMPYMDTFVYLHSTSKGFFMTNKEDKESICCLSTNGTELVTCEECGNLSLEDEYFLYNEHHHRVMVCCTCNENANSCDNCGYRFNYSLELEVDTQIVCNRCFEASIICPHCNKRGFSYGTVDGDIVCRNCYCEAKTCWHCGELSFSHKVATDGYFYCPECFLTVFAIEVLKEEEEVTI
jgi:hypothetical protein